MSRRGRQSRVPPWLPRLHRWLGLASLIFVLLLSVTGIALNHSNALHLEQRFIGASWVLRWYGIDAPPPTASFGAAGHTLTLIGERLYFDEQEFADNVDGLVGVVAAGGTTDTSAGETLGQFLIVATPTRVLIAAQDGTLVEWIDTTAMLPGEILALGRSAGGVIYRTAAGLYRSDENVLAFSPRTAQGAHAVNWSAAVAVPPERLATLERLYRGRGLSLQRVLLDLHSGRAFSRLGPWLMDAVALALIAISLLGLLLWWRRRLDAPRGPS